MSNAWENERLAIAGGPRAVTERMPNATVMGLSEYLGLARVLWSGNLGRVDGQVVKQLEAAFVRAYGVRHAVASTSGTAALHVALAAVNPEPYAEVITSSITDMGSVIPILACGCRPVFADVDPQTGNLTADSIAAKVTPRTRAILLVHLFGRPAADLPAIRDLADRHGLALIEDCSQAHLAEYGGGQIGTFGHLGCFSFQQSKQMTSGEGGVTLTNDPMLAERAALFTDKGWARGEQTRRYLFLGMNYRMTEMQGALALAQLRRLPGLMEARRGTAQEFCQGLSQVPGIHPPVVHPLTNPAWCGNRFAIDEAKLGVSTDAFFGARSLRESRCCATTWTLRPSSSARCCGNGATFGTSGYPLNALGPDVPPGTSCRGGPRSCPVPPISSAGA